MTVQVQESHGGAMVTLVLDAPKANVLDAAMIAALKAELGHFRERPGLKLVVIEGQGKHFSFGASVKEHLPGEVERMLPSFHALFRALEDVGVPTAAVVRGQCLGGGFELALACGWVFCSTDARFAVPEVGLGVFPPVAAVMLPWRLGGAKATDLVVTGRFVNGPEALELGLVDACTEDPRGTLEEWYHTHLDPKSAVGVGLAWQAARRPLRKALDEDLLAVERLYLQELMKHKDPLEGLHAFLEGRAPHWSHA